MHVHFPCAAHGVVKVVQLEPQDDAVAVRAKLRVSEGAVMVVNIPVVPYGSRNAAAPRPVLIDHGKGLLRWFCSPGERECAFSVSRQCVKGR